MKKLVKIDNKAKKEIEDFPIIVQDEFIALFFKLGEKGMLIRPEGDKFSGLNNLYEVIVKKQGQYRAIFAYIFEDTIIVLHAFMKKSQKTPKKDIKLAIKRLKEY